MSESPPTSTRKIPQDSPQRRRWLLIVFIVGGILLLLTAVGLMLFLGLRGVLFEGEASPGMPLEVIKLTPTVSTSPLSPPSCETIISSGDVQVAVPLPISLTVGSESFPVVAVIPPTSPFPPLQGGTDEEGAAAWVCGTVVNYVVGMGQTPENEALLDNLRPGDEIKLHLSNGVELSFRFAERREVTANEAGVFEQFRPRLTLILERESTTWQVATADYVAETEAIQPPSETLTRPGQTVRVGDVQLTVLKGHADRSGPDLLPGTMYYLVEFSVENIGPTLLNANAFTLQLQDGAGNQYLLSPAASAAGEYGPLNGEINPGTMVQSTAGYLVPEALAGPTLIWTFSPRPGSELRTSVSIPYQAEAGSAAPGQAEVNITDAFLSDNGDVLIVEGEVRNTGAQQLTVEVGDISLTSVAGMSDLRMAAPLLPWTIEPGQVQVIELQYAKPNASTALLSLMGYSFEIQGL
ncbi:MAG: DUF4352 domain-containing protein [Chloroflexota bacterium]|nr:DUF4352 domain-containing protein [Chloroflexota bacterium]